MKICLAGTGAMGVIHMKALQKIESVEVVAVASRTGESGRAFAEEWNIPFHSSDVAACIDRPGVDRPLSMKLTCRHVEASRLIVLSYEFPLKTKPSSGNWFHCLHATSHALQPMQMLVSVKNPFGI